MHNYLIWVLANISMYVVFSIKLALLGPGPSHACCKAVYLGHPFPHIIIWVALDLVSRYPDVVIYQPPVYLIWCGLLRLHLSLIVDRVGSSLPPVPLHRSSCLIALLPSWQIDLSLPHYYQLQLRFFFRL